ncbi:MAG: hypothetical protein HFH35_09550 [Eubacterium sp.]|nr:hypothetical protein [Eubacterium sp.]
MGMMVGGIHSSRNVVRLKRPDGSVAATVSFSKPAPKKKRLSYSFKSVSSQIMMAKSSNAAGKAVTKARSTLAMLLRKVETGDYDEQELEDAIKHARKMERVAKKRQKHLKQEEDLKQKGHTEETAEEEVSSEEKEKEKQEQIEQSEEEIQKLMEEYERMIEKAMQDAMKELQEEMQFDELSEDMEDASQDMKPEDFERLKKKHRSDEMREMADADMKYLRAFFNRLQKEKEALSNASAPQNNAIGGITLELSGLAMPVETAQAPPVSSEGASVDVTL